MHSYSIDHQTTTCKHAASSQTHSSHQSQLTSTAAFLLVLLVVLLLTRHRAIAHLVALAAPLQSLGRAATALTLIDQLGKYFLDELKSFCVIAMLCQLSHRYTSGGRLHVGPQFIQQFNRTHMAMLSSYQYWSGTSVIRRVDISSQLNQ